VGKGTAQAEQLETLAEYNNETLHEKDSSSESKRPDNDGDDVAEDTEVTLIDEPTGSHVVKHVPTKEKATRPKRLPPSQRKLPSVITDPKKQREKFKSWSELAWAFKKFCALIDCFGVLYLSRLAPLQDDGGLITGRRLDRPKAKKHPGISAIEFGWRGASSYRLRKRV
jgi:hypothetical protein